MAIARPNVDGLSDWQKGYVAQVPQGADLLALLAGQSAELRALALSISEDASGIRPAPAEWSVKEVLGHINDGERVFGYRAFAISRGDKATFPGFDQDEYVAGTDFNKASVADLLEEFDHLRRANLLQLAHLSDATLDIKGNVSTYQISPRALLYVMAGHVQHHIVSFKETYGLSAA
jgi:hypothetical protein